MEGNVKELWQGSVCLKNKMEGNVKEICQGLMLNLLESRPPDPLNHITKYLTRLSLQSTPLSQAVDAAISLQYTSLCTGSFNDQVYEIYSILTDDTYDGLAGGISNQIYKEFITRFISKIDMKLLHESLRINTLYPYQQPCCITYSQFKESITTAVSMREYCRLGRELYYSVHNMTKEIASDLLRQLSDGESPSSDNALLFLSQNLTEEEFLKEVLKLFQQQYSKCKKD